jgi:hypothetical protein
MRLARLRAGSRRRCRRSCRTRRRSSMSSGPAGRDGNRAVEAGQPVAAALGRGGREAAADSRSCREPLEGLTPVRPRSGGGGSCSSRARGGYRPLGRGPGQPGRRPGSRAARLASPSRQEAGQASWQAQAGRKQARQAAAGKGVSQEAGRPQTFPECANDRVLSQKSGRVASISGARARARARQRTRQPGRQEQARQKKGRRGQREEATAISKALYSRPWPLR